MRERRTPNPNPPFLGFQLRLRPSGSATIRRAKLQARGNDHWDHGHYGCIVVVVDRACRWRRAAIPILAVCDLGNRVWSARVVALAVAAIGPTTAAAVACVSLIAVQHNGGKFAVFFIFIRQQYCNGGRGGYIRWTERQGRRRTSSGTLRERFPDTFPLLRLLVGAIVVVVSSRQRCLAVLA